MFINLFILTITKYLLKQVQKSVDKLLKKTKIQQVLIFFFCVEQDSRCAKFFQDKKQNLIEILNSKRLVRNTYLFNKNTLQTQYNSWIYRVIKDYKSFDRKDL